MMIIGCDFHPSWQQVSWLDTETGETGEQKLVQASGDAEGFYRQVAAPALIGMEATGNCHWLVDLLAELGHELWVGDAAQIRASYVRQQKTDKRDAAHILKLLVEGRFPRIWMPSSEVRDLRQLLLHRYKLVIIRARVKNELQHLCLNKGVQRKHKLWSQAGQQILRELPLKPWAARRRDDLLKLMAMLDQQIEPLDQAVQEEAQRDKMALLLQTQPWVGPITALAYVLTMGDVSRFPRGKQVARAPPLCEGPASSVVIRNENPRPVSPKTGETRAGHPVSKIRRKGWASPIDRLPRDVASYVSTRKETGVETLLATSRVSVAGPEGVRP